MTEETEVLTASQGATTASQGKAYFQYVGDGNDTPIEIKLWGKYECEFNGDPIEISDPDEIAKIRRLPTFIETTKTGKPVNPKEKDERKAAQKKQRARRAAAKKRNEEQKRIWENEQKRLERGDDGADGESGAVDLGD